LSPDGEKATRAYQHFCKKLNLISNVKGSDINKHRYELEFDRTETNLNVELKINAEIDFSSFDVNVDN
jgi:hypothetical protein